MEEVEINPLEYFSNAPHVVDLILDHLKVAELVKLTEVSPAFNKIISNSTKWTKKVKFDGTQFALEETKRRSRRYENFKFREMASNCLVTQAKKNIDKETFIRSLEVYNERLIGSLLTKEQMENLTELKIVCDSYDDFGFDDNHYQIDNRTIYFMNNLKTIHFVGNQNVGDEMCQNLRGGAKNLKELVIEKSAANLTYQVIYMVSKSTRIKLEKISICDHSSYNNANDKKHLLTLMENQSQSLTTAKFDLWVTTPVIKQLLRMPCLKILHLFELSKSGTNWETIKLPVSPSITQLHLDDLKDNKHLLKAFLEACPNVVELKVHALTKEIREVVRQHGKNVLNIEVH